MHYYDRVNACKMALFELGIKTGKYLSDVRYDELAEPERQRLHAEAKSIIRKRLYPKAEIRYVTIRKYVRGEGWKDVTLEMRKPTKRQSKAVTMI